jgi:hypothetical protein
MPVYVDPRSGTVYQNVPEEEEERARSEYGLVPSAEWESIQETQKADTKGPLGLIGEGFQRGLGHIQDAAGAVGWSPPMPGGDAFGPGGGALPSFGAPDPVAPPVPSGAETFPEAFSDEAKLRTQAHPVWTGIGTGLAAAPASALAGAAAGALGGPAILGAAAGGILAEQAVEAVAQEWDDAWLEGRPMELKNVAAYTAMFSVGDVLFRGIGKGLSAGYSKLKEPGTLSRNIVSEAQSRAAGAGVRPTQSVGAASAKEMSEPFDEALATMDLRDAEVLVRDADDHSFLIARHAADEMTRIERGLSEQLGTQLKYEDFRIGADAWDEKTLARQGVWVGEMLELGQGVINQIRAASKGFENAPEFGNLGKVIAGDVADFTKRISQETDYAQRNVLLDAFKKQGDKRMMAIDGSYNVDPITREELKKIIRPLFGVDGALRAGLENKKLFGHNAELQKALNKPWHDLLQHWRTLQDKLTETTGAKQFDNSSAGRVVRESTTERMRGVLGKDQRELEDFAVHVKEGFDAYQRLIEAREAHGITHKDGLPELKNSLTNLMEDWNLAATISVARNKVGHAARDPQNYMKAALDAAEGVAGVGGIIKGARNLARTVGGDLHIQKGTPLADVWDRAYKRYAQHPSLADPSILQNYSPWMQEALRARGAQIPAPAGLGAAAMGAAKEYGGKVAGVGLVGAGAASAAEGQRDPNAPMQAGAGPAGAILTGLAMMLGKGGRRLLKEEAAPLIGILSRQEGKDDWTTTRVRQWLKSDAPLSVRAIERENTKPALVDGLWVNPEEPTPLPELRAFVADAVERTGASEDMVVRAIVSEGTGFKPKAPRAEGAAPRKPKGPTPPAPPVEDRTGIEGDFDDMGDQLLTPPDMKEALKDARRAVGKQGQAAFKAYQSQAGFKMNEAMRTGDFSSWGAERAGDVSAYLQNAIDSGATAPGFVVRGVELPKEEVQRLTAAKLLTAQAFVSTTPNVGIAKRFAGTAKRGDTGFRKTIGDVPVMFEIEQATGVPLSAGEVTLRPGTQFKVLAHRVERVGTKAEPKIVHVFRVRESGYAPGAKTEGLIAGGLIGIGGVAAAGNASAAEPQRAPMPDMEPPPDNGPTGLYRDAMRTIAEGGDTIIRSKASSALRSRQPQGRSPLRAFMGRRSLDASVDATRSALEELQADPSALVDRLAGSVGELGRTHPSVYMALTEKAANIVAYLSAEAPKRVGRTLLDPEGMAPSMDRSVDFALKVVGASMPEQALNDIARLDAPPEELAAFQQHWPELWEPLRMELLGQVQSRYQAGRPVDAEKLRALDALLQMDGQLDPSGSMAVAQQLLSAQEQAPAAQASNSPPSGAPSGKASSSFRTRAGRMETQVA